MEEYVQITLITKSTSYPVPSYPITVPTSSTPAELNGLLKNLIEESRGFSLMIEFIFLIQNEYLTTSIADHLAEKQLASEILEIEYCEKQQAPLFADEIRQDDLISSVKRHNNLILTGSYDGTVQLWTVENPKPVFVIELDDKVKCVEWLSFDSLNSHEATFVTGGFDQAARIWLWNLKTGKVKCVAVCRGHSETVMTAASRSIAESSDNPELFATGSWDGTLKLWSSSATSMDLPEETGGIVHTRKSKEKTPTRVPRLTLAGHRETVTRVCWLPTSSDQHGATGTQLISVSWDHSLRVWDCQVCGEQKGSGGSEVRSIVASHAFHDADAALQGILTASSDNRVRIYDLRAQEALSLVGFHGHSAWLTSVAWAPHREDQFITGSVDRSVRLWDTRNTKASLYDLMGHSDMVTDVDWARPIEQHVNSLPSELSSHFILSSSADGTVKIYAMPH